MNQPWKTYQEECASLFRSIGLNAEVEKSVDGVRGTHLIDVFVTGVVSGIQLVWVVECKAWKTNIPKEKVLALMAIVQDTGADKGILLSETGFQSGAIKNAKNTNVLLTSLDDLREQVREDLNQSTISRLHWRKKLVYDRISDFHDGMDRTMNPHIDQLIKIMCLDMAFDHALRGDFPTLYCRLPFPVEQRFYANSLEELVQESSKLLSEAEAYADHIEASTNSHPR